MKKLIVNNFLVVCLALSVSIFVGCDDGGDDGGGMGGSGGAGGEGGAGAAGGAGGEGGAGAAGGAGGAGAAGGAGGAGAAGGAGGAGAAGGAGGEGGMMIMDADMDGVADADDNCPEAANEDQADADMDGIGDVCDDDRDGDMAANDADNCADAANEDQADADMDGIGDVCDDDRDGDMAANDADNCPDVANADQVDLDMDGAGDACDEDRDGDMAPNDMDNCADVANGDQADLDMDMIGDVCDDDMDGDMVANDMDNCPMVANEDQADLDEDATGDVCDDDRDGDMVANADDNCADAANADQADGDMDELGDACDDDNDNDEIANAEDNCPTVANADQADSDGAPVATFNAIDVNVRALTDAAVSIELRDDQGSDAINIGFEYAFFGQSYEQVYVGSNGLASFINTGVSSTANTNLARDSAPNAVIAGFWDDLNPSDGGSIRTELLGEAPNREFVIDFTGVPHYAFGGSDATVSFQIVLSEQGGGEIICVDCQADASAPSASQGLNSPDGSYWLIPEGRNNSDFSAVNDALAFTAGVAPDGVGDACDVCPDAYDAGQENNDGDDNGDACDDDDDNDEILDADDNCPLLAGEDQTDTDRDGAGNLCDDDDDNDEIADGDDNCPLVPNNDQANADEDEFGDACDDDSDNDGVANAEDNCVSVANPDQANGDEDALGDACDNCAAVDNPDQADSDRYNATWNAIEVNAREMTDAAVDLPLGDDQLSGAIAIGFDYSYFGETYAQLYVGSNGLVAFQPNGVSSTNSANLANDSAPNAVIAPFWADLNPSAGGTIRHELLGEAPNRAFVVAFDAVPHYGLAEVTVSFQVVLLEQGGGEIICTACNGEQHSVFTPGVSQGLNSPDGSYSLVPEGRLTNTFSSNNEAFGFTTEALEPDGYGDACDVCPTVNNPGQEDGDEDGVGNLCDNCADIANGDQANLDNDALGNVCDEDIDGDGANNDADLCPEVAAGDGGHTDLDMDGAGDACDDDRDGDTVANGDDNCPDGANQDQADQDEDGQGDVCDDDRDGDTVANDADNCADVANLDQANLDNDALGDACDDDRDGDTVANDTDNCPNDANEDQADSNENGIGDVCDFDPDEDGIASGEDNCPEVANVGQEDTDEDGTGDACDPDIDGDNVANGADNCPGVANADQADADASQGRIWNIEGAARAFGDGAMEVALADDDATGAIELGFAHTFYGVEYDSVYIGSNGVLSFTGEGADSFSPTRINSAGLTDGLVAACWTDLAANTVRYELQGEAPNREFLVAWDAGGWAGAGAAAQIVIREQGGGEFFVTRCDGGWQGIEDAEGENRIVVNGILAAAEFTSAAVSDGAGDACDTCPNTMNEDQTDTDGDGLGDFCDICPNAADADQVDTDADGEGDVCDIDDDNDGNGDDIDNCPLVSNADGSDIDEDGVGDACDDDDDGDGVADDADNCPTVANEDQADADENGRGDACEGVGCNMSYDFEGGMIPDAFETGGAIGFDFAPGTGRGGEGSAAQSGGITHNQQSTMSLTIDAGEGATLSYWYKVSSERTWDSLFVYVDDNEVAEYTGEVDWTEATLELGVGEHTIVWSYVKDGSANGGQDTAWIDDVSFINACLP